MKTALTLIAATLLCAGQLLAYTVTPLGAECSYAFSLKGTTGDTNIENIERDGRFYIHLYNRYSVVCSGFKMESDKKGKTYTGGYSSEQLTYKVKKGSFKYAASSVNAMFTLGTYDKNGNRMYETTFDTKGKAKAKGVILPDITSQLDSGRFLGFYSNDYDGEFEGDFSYNAVVLSATDGFAIGKPGKSYKYSVKYPDGTKLKFSLKCKTGAISLAYKTSTRVMPAFID